MHKTYYFEIKSFSNIIKYNLLTIYILLKEMIIEKLCLYEALQYLKKRNFNITSILNIVC